MTTELQPVHPGEILREEYLRELHMSAGALAKKLGVPRTRIERLVKETTPVTVDTALRLAKFFHTTPQFWINLQTSYDIKTEVRSLEKELEKIEPLADFEHAA